MPLTLTLMIKNALTVRTEMNRVVPLNLVVKLWWQSHPATLTGPAPGFSHRQSVSPAEDHFVPLKQCTFEIASHQVAFEALLGYRNFEVFNLCGDFLLGLGQLGQQPLQLRSKFG